MRLIRTREIGRIWDGGKICVPRAGPNLQEPMVPHMNKDAGVFCRGVRQRRVAGAGEVMTIERPIAVHGCVRRLRRTLLLCIARL